VSDSRPADRRFEWREVTTVYRDVKTSSQGDELRWLLNRERIHDRLTGDTLERSIIRHPGICVIVAQPDPDHVLLVRQYRFAVDGELWELPAGTITGRQDGTRMVAVETPQACAARELREEAGYEASQWNAAARCYVMPGSHEELMHVFVAKGLTRVGQALEEGEVIAEVRAFSSAELERMIASGEIRDAKTLVGLLYVLGGRPGGLRLA
jgi:ADP-ribose pyrophosphatase